LQITGIIVLSAITRQNSPAQQIQTTKI